MNWARRCCAGFIHSILDRQNNQLRDDATLLLIEWRPPRP